jgi:hypothetical protein
MNYPIVSRPELKRWYDKTLHWSAVATLTTIDIILPFYGATFYRDKSFAMPRLLLIAEECIVNYLIPTFAHCGLALPPDNYDLE